MKQLIQDLLLFSRLGTESEKMGDVDLNKVMEIVVQTYSLSIDENKAKITSTPLPVVTGSKIQLTQVFQNLVGNALKYKNEQSPEIEINYKEGGKEWIFSVKDNGIGIDPKFYDKIFIIFQRL